LASVRRIMTATWPLDAVDDDDTPLPPPWDGAVDLSDLATETAFLALRLSQPEIALRVCRSAFRTAEANSDEQAATYALYFASVGLYQTSRRALADRMFALVRERARDMGLCRLTVRIELTHARQLDERGEHAQAMVLWQHSLGTAMALGDSRTIFVALGCLAHAVNVADDAELSLSLCEQQAWYLPRNDILWLDFYSNRANLMALASTHIARVCTSAGDLAAGRVALRRARAWALLACARARGDRETLHGLETLVQILLESGESARARAEVDRWTARLAAMPRAGSEMWCVLQVARARIDVHDGNIGPQTLEALRMIDDLPHDAASDLQLYVGHVRQVLLRALEQLGHHEQALACHKRATEWVAQHRSTQARQRIKMLRHTVLAMRTEAVEFVTHDLLTPLAAAQTWSQALLKQQLPPAAVHALRSAQRLLADAATLAEQYLCCLRAELMPRSQLQTLDIGALADDVCESMGICLDRAIDIGTPVVGDATLLTKALAALLSEASSRAPTGTGVELSLKHDSVKGEAVLSIRHEGGDPTSTVRTRLYQRAFDHDAFGAVPLGLALAAKVCRLHAMRLRFDRSQGRSSRLRLTMRTRADSAATSASAAPAESDIGLRKKATS
jgi:signal transduction histidine kinase